MILVGLMGWLAAPSGLAEAATNAPPPPPREASSRFDSNGHKLEIITISNALVVLSVARNNPTWIDLKLNGSESVVDGFYSWIAPQNEWINPEGKLCSWPPDPIFKETAYASAQAEGQTITVGAPVSERYGLSFRKTFVLDPKKSEITVTLCAKNESNRTCSWGLQNLVCLRHEQKRSGVIFIPDAKKSDVRYYQGYALKLKDDAHSKALWDSHLSDSPRGLRVAALEHIPAQTYIKWYLPKGPTTIVVERSGVRFTRSFDLETKASYPDFDSPIQTYGDATLCEMEALSPRMTIPPQGEISFTERWKLETIAEQGGSK